MYIPEFWVGVGATLLTEVLAFVLFCAYTYYKETKK